jgi:hypothetical protein
VAAQPEPVDGAAGGSLWTPVGVVAGADAEAAAWIRPERFRLYELDQAAFVGALAKVPMEPAADMRGGVAIAQPGEAFLEMRVPMPDGTLARFRVVESPVMAPELAARYPQIKTYVGQGVDDPTASARLDWTPKGFHAQVLSADGAAYVDPYLRGNTSLHVSYYKRDFGGPPMPFSCQLDGTTRPVGDGAVATALLRSGETLRTYRLACAATGEYTQYHGGAVADGLAAIVTAVNRVTGIYEVDVAARLELVANNDQLVYTNPSTDPYSNTDGITMLGQNQSNVDAVIGSANYDIGHVFSTGGGGVAYLGVVCATNWKARGVTGRGAPIGDPFYVDYVAHEMGHQFGANHSFNGVNGNCSGGNRNASTAYEPGSGSTIMAYAGICGADDLQSHSDPYFHAVSFDEIRDYITNDWGDQCPVETVTGNAPPTVSAGPDYTIPSETPFALTASASDPDGDMMTYCWEEHDLGPAAALYAADDGAIPLFRSWEPTTDPTRTFPRLVDLLDNVSRPGEKLPVLSRTMEFRATVRDNRAGGGGVAWDDMLVTVDGNSGPFRVTSPNTSVLWAGNQTVTWDVAGTYGPPVNAATVDILLSDDGGYTYPYVLAAGTPNDGSQVVTLPGLGTSTARVKVEAVDNIFFDVSDANFTVAEGSCWLAAPPTPEPGVVVAKNRYLAVAPGNAGLTTAVRVTVVDLPPGFEAWVGAALWLGEPAEVSENGGVVLPADAPSYPTFWAVALSCEPHFTDWGAYGTVYAYHQGVIPGGVYAAQVIESACALADEGNYSTPLEITTSGWCDVVSNCVMLPCGPPDGVVNITTDVTAIVDKFKNLPGSAMKSRCDVEPATPDLLINITDVGAAIEAFLGSRYPFETPPPCP